MDSTGFVVTIAPSRHCITLIMLLTPNILPPHKLSKFIFLHLFTTLFHRDYSLPISIQSASAYTCKHTFSDGCVLRVSDNWVVRTDFSGIWNALAWFGGHRFKPWSCIGYFCPSCTWSRPKIFFVSVSYCVLATFTSRKPWYVTPIK